MNKLRAAMFVKNERMFLREGRNMGYFSYAVDLFEWDHFTPGSGTVNLAEFRNYDFIFHEDGGNWCSYLRPEGVDCPPVVYLAIDSTLSEEHLRVRQRQGARADLVLVDHDELWKFGRKGKAAERLAYCVNERLFRKQGEKKNDIAYHCSYSEHNPGREARLALKATLEELAEGNGWSLRTGGLAVEEYALSMAESRVVVNWPRTVNNRPHRLFDAMACGALVLTGAAPVIEEDHLFPGLDYEVFEGREDLQETLGWMLQVERWKAIADAGYAAVMEKHTWATRARELREILRRRLGI